MPTSTDYQNQYASYVPILQGVSELGDTSSLKDRMQKQADYNKPLLDAMATNQAKKENITNAARWVENPAMQGMSINDRNTIKNTNMAGANQEGNAIGAYYTARQEDLASAITAWKEAWQAKYNAAQEGAKGAQNLQGMAFAGEQEAEKVRQFNAEQAQAMAIARMQEAGANARAASSGTEDAPVPWQLAMGNDVESMKQVLGKQGTGKYAREQIINTMQNKYGLGDAARNEQIRQMMYGVGPYKGQGLTPDNWERAYQSGSSIFG